MIEDWRIDYNTKRPHTNFSGLSPWEFAIGFAEDQNRNEPSS